VYILTCSSRLVSGTFVDWEAGLFASTTTIIACEVNSRSCTARSVRPGHHDVVERAVRRLVAAPTAHTSFFPFSQFLGAKGWLAQPRLLLRTWPTCCRSRASRSTPCYAGSTFDQATANAGTCNLGSDSLSYYGRRTGSRPSKSSCGNTFYRACQEDDMVCVNRQPSLSKYSLMGFEVKRGNSRVMIINQCVTVAFNTDFDGDDMNVFLLDDVRLVD
jgi:hypothetical protein